INMLANYSDSGVISVQLATFGRTSSQICSNFEYVVYPVVCLLISLSLNRCDGLRECEIGTQGLASKDPCFGTYKYYTTNYICIPMTWIHLRNAIFFYLHVENCKIQINTANYGRTDKTTCSEGRPSSELLKVFVSLIYILSLCRCEGKNSCSILASNSVFSDPCVGTIKYLYISYSCVSKCDCTEQ
uniref:SUEL-type lectin domain-containing protein n=1 Tax=Sinocyclocheilus anshuiensis TaxID=1608454 RepID=A0A671S713_9TELE